MLRYAYRIGMPCPDSIFTLSHVPLLSCTLSTRVPKTFLEPIPQSPCLPYPCPRPSPLALSASLSLSLPIISQPPHIILESLGS